MPEAASISSLTFAKSDGSATISGIAVRLCRGLSRQEALSALAPLFRSALDHGNGHEWLSFNGVSFGGQTCSFALLFRAGSVAEIHFSVMLPDAELESGWPTKRAIESELAFVRRELGAQLCARIGGRGTRFPWGSAWSVFDPKGYQAGSGVRYAG